MPPERFLQTVVWLVVIYTACHLTVAHRKHPWIARLGPAIVQWISPTLPWCDANCEIHEEQE